MSKRDQAGWQLTQLLPPEHWNAGLHIDYSSQPESTEAESGRHTKSRVFFWHSQVHVWPITGGLEYSAFLLATMLPGVFDIRRRVPLSQQKHDHEICKYIVRPQLTGYPGTDELARKIGLPHSEAGSGQPEQMCTDVVVTFISPNSRQLELMAVCVRELSPASIEEINHLRLEREYWLRQGVQWLLITPHEMHKQIHNHLLAGASYALSDWRAQAFDLSTLEKNARRFSGLSWLSAFALVMQLTGLSQSEAVFVLWQAIWRGQIPLDLRHAGRSGFRLRLVSKNQFESLNPLRVGRSHSLDVSAAES